MRRTAKRAVVLAGEQVEEGDKVVMYFGSANRDPEKFDRPDTLDLSRAPNDHIAFGTGPHGCLGQRDIARIEIDAILMEVLTRLEDFADRGRAGMAALQLHLRPETPAGEVQSASLTPSLSAVARLNRAMTIIKLIRAS